MTNPTPPPDVTPSDFSQAIREIGGRIEQNYGRKTLGVTTTIEESDRNTLLIIASGLQKENEQLKKDNHELKVSYVVQDPWSHAHQIEELHRKDSLKTREYNILVKENRSLEERLEQAERVVEAARDVTKHGVNVGLYGLTLLCSIKEYDSARASDNSQATESAYQSEFDKIEKLEAENRSLEERLKEMKRFLIVAGIFGGYVKSIRKDNTEDWMEGFWEYFKEFETQWDKLMALARASNNSQATESATNIQPTHSEDCALNVNFRHGCTCGAESGGKEV